MVRIIHHSHGKMTRARKSKSFDTKALCVTLSVMARAEPMTAVRERPRFSWYSVKSPLMLSISVGSNGRVIGGSAPPSARRRFKTELSKTVTPSVNTPRRSRPVQAIASKPIALIMPRIASGFVARVRSASTSWSSRPSSRLSIALSIALTKPSPKFCLSPLALSVSRSESVAALLPRRGLSGRIVAASMRDFDGFLIASMK